MKILHNTDGSLLWLWEANAEFKNNLKSEASKRGINPDRLIFSKTASIKEHYSRLSLADLSLDTFPYGSHSTGLISLWSGVPLIGYHGDTPASRVSSALLSACGLSDLIISGGVDDYIDFASNLANDQSKLIEYKDKLYKSTHVDNVFSPVKFSNLLGSIFLTAWERYESSSIKSSFHVDQ